MNLPKRQVNESGSRWPLPVLGLMLFFLNALVFIAVNAGMPTFVPAFPALSTTETTQLPLFLLGYVPIRTVILLYIVSHLSVQTLKGSIVLALVLFGLENVLTQLESVWFRSAFPALSNRNLALILTSSLLEKLIGLPIAVWMLRKRPPTAGQQTWTDLLNVAGQRKWLMLPVAYVVIYFFFGYFIAWQSPSLRRFYTGHTHLDGFLTHMLNIDPWLILLQYGRGLAWLVLAILLRNLFVGRSMAYRLSIILIGGGLIPTALLLPNPLMPETVRYNHLV